MTPKESNDSLRPWLPTTRSHLEIHGGCCPFEGCRICNEVKLWIGGPLPGLNELIDEAKKGRGKGNGYARVKKAWTDSIALVAKAHKLPRFERARLSFRWVERDRRRDPDNVAAGGRKLILDGLVVAKVLPGDGWAHVAGWTDAFEVGPQAGVEVTIEAA